MRETQQVDRAGLEHPAFFYDGVEDFVATMAPYVTEGVDKDEAVFIAARTSYLGPLRAAVGPAADEAMWVDTWEWQPHPSRRLRAFHELVTARLAEGATRLRLAGEPAWPEGPIELVQEWERYESVLNEVLGPYPVSLVCLYETSSLHPSVLEGALHTHRTMLDASGTAESDTYEEPSAFLRRVTRHHGRPPAHAGSLNLTDAATGRRYIEARAGAAGLDAETTMELLLAANEVLTNAFVHAPGARLHTWTEDGRFVCQVDDSGDGIADPLIGYRPPSEHGEGGRGIWIARQLVDLLQISTGPEGTSIRLHVSL